MTASDTGKLLRWIPTLYFAQGLPYVAVMTLSVVMYKNLALSNTEIALYTSWLYLPWVIKPLWAPLVDLVGSKRGWVVGTQLLVGGGLAAVGLLLPVTDFVRWTLVAFWLMAFSSATHDIAADGFYMLALHPHQQAAYVGVRSTFYRLAMIAGQGGLVYLAGMLQARSGSFFLAWQGVFLLMSASFFVFAMYHRWILPRPAGDTLQDWPLSSLGRDFIAVFSAFFKRPGIGVMLTFLLLYRFPEAQLLKLAVPFLLDPPSAGGLGLSTQEVGIVYGTVGVTALTIGGILGGLAIARFGLRQAIWPLVLCVHLPNLIFVLLAFYLPVNLWLVGSALAVEQFGYGFGFTAYMLYMIMISRGPHQTAHYAICTGFMALGMMLPGMFSGWLQAQLGYLNFFIWVCAAAIPSLYVVSLVKIDARFGKKDPG
ncbi:MAG: MFS transporter [Betaproteobacteria bacterium]|nr:MFS transporter [Betaproteobacteria bacterium]